MNAALDVVRYSITDATIAEMSAKYMGLIVKDPTDEAGFAAAHNARTIVKGKRIEVEKKRVELKADALKYGRAVDAEAKRIKALLQPIEEHLIAQEKIVTDEKDRKEREAQEKAERERLEAIEQERREEEDRIRAEREAEEKRLAEEREKLAAERAAMQAERERIEAAQKAERERLAIIEMAQKAEADKLAAEKARIAQEEAKRQRIIEAENAELVAKLKAEREAAEAKSREEAAKRQAEEERERLEAMRPDAEKIRVYGAALLAVLPPMLKTEEARTFLSGVLSSITVTANKCSTFYAGKEK